MAQPVLHQSGVYYFRRKVPEALRKVLGHEYKRSLGTREPGEAKRLYALEWEKCESMFAIAKAQVAGAATLTQRDMRILAQSWYDVELAKLEASGDFSSWLASGSTVITEQADRLIEHTNMITLGEALNQFPEDEDLVDTLGIVRTALRNRDIPMPVHGSPEFISLTGAFREQWLKLSETALARYRGDWTPSSRS